MLSVGIWVAVGSKYALLFHLEWCFSSPLLITATVSEVRLNWLCWFWTASEKNSVFLLLIKSCVHYFNVILLEHTMWKLSTDPGRAQMSLTDPLICLPSLAPPFEPLEQVALKTALLLPLNSAEWIGETPGFPCMHLAAVDLLCWNVTTAARFVFLMRRRRRRRRRGNRGHENNSLKIILMGQCLQGKVGPQHYMFTSLFKM